MTIPTLESARLRLREHRAEDHTSAFAMWSSPDVVRFIGIPPSTCQQAWARLLNYRGHWAVMDFGYWAVEEKSSGLYIGDVGFSDFKRDVVPSIEGLPELGWVIAPSHQGKGFATEALMAACAWADRKFSHDTSIPRAVCMIDPSNSVSIRVAEKIGFQEYVRTSYAGTASVLLERKFSRSTGA